MSIPDEVRDRDEAIIRAWFARQGVPTIHLPAADVFEGAWNKYARCGQWQPDAPDPETFFPMEADYAATYKAQEYCLQCPVRNYCDDWATKRREPGIWAGIFRDEYRRVSPLCVTPGCMRYRRKGEPVCNGCRGVIRAEQAAQRAARESAREAAEGLEVVAA